MQIREPAVLANTSDSAWLHKFKVPEQFSRRTMEAIALGNITRGVHIEVIGAVAVQMMQYTTTPTSQVYYVCAHLSFTLALLTYVAYV